MFLEMSSCFFFKKGKSYKGFFWPSNMFLFCQCPFAGLTSLYAKPISHDSGTPPCFFPDAGNTVCYCARMTPLSERNLRASAALSY